MRRVGATGTCERDKHEGRPDDTDMRVLSEPDNMEVQQVCKTEQTEPRSPGKQAADTSPKVGGGVDLGQDSGGGVKEKDNQSRNLGPSTQQQQATRARRSLVAPAIGNNSEKHQLTQIGVVNTAAEQSRKVGVQIRQENQQEEQEDRECDARAAPCQEDADPEQDLQIVGTGGDSSRIEDGDSAREDRAHAQARARQATQVPMNKTSGTSGEEEAETQTEAFPDQTEDGEEDGGAPGEGAFQKSASQGSGEDQNMATRPVSKPTLSAAAARHCRAQMETSQTERNPSKCHAHAELVGMKTGGEQNKLLERPRVPFRDCLSAHTLTVSTPTELPVLPVHPVQSEPRGPKQSSPANVTAAVRTESCIHPEEGKSEGAGSSCSRVSAATLVGTGKTEMGQANGGEMGQANGGEMRQSEGVQAPTLSATGVSTVPDARTGGRVEAVFGWQGEHSVASDRITDGGPGGLPAQPDTDCGTHTEANGGAGVQPAAATKDTGGDVSAATSGASVLRNQPGPAMRDGSDESDVDAHSAEELRVAVHAILTEAGAESVAMEEKKGCRRRASAITKTATRRLQEVMKQAEVVEHRGAAAEAGEAEMEAAESRVGQETEVPVTMEAEATVLTEAELLAQMAADEAEIDAEAKKTGETVPWFVQEPTRRQAAPEIGPPNVWSQIKIKIKIKIDQGIRCSARISFNKSTLSHQCITEGFFHLLSTSGCRASNSNNYRDCFFS